MADVVSQLSKTIDVKPGELWGPNVHIYHPCVEKSLDAARTSACATRLRTHRAVSK